MELLRRHDVALEGAEAVVVGRSDLVGKPVGALLLAANATVTICHSRTRDLAGVCRRADVLVAAVGVPNSCAGDWVKPGAVVIDVGINRTDDGLVGDVEFAAARERARLITPGAGRRRADDDRDAAAQHAGGGASADATVRRLRRGEWLAAAGGVALLAVLWAPWYDDANAWRAFAVLDVLLALLWRCSASPPPSCRRRGASPALPAWRPRSSPRRSASSS